MRFSKKPVEIEAIQFNGTSECAMRISDEFRMEYDECQFDEHKLIIHTLEGNMIASNGDWIIKGVKGEFYPCKPDIFDLTYEVVE